MASAGSTSTGLREHASSILVALLSSAFGVTLLQVTDVLSDVISADPLTGASGTDAVMLAVVAWVFIAIALAGIAALLPRTKGPLELAALSAAVLLAVELTLTHWFYLYLPWVLPFVLLAVFLPREGAPERPGVGAGASP